MDISIIIVNWNTGDLLYNCVKSINENIHKYNYEVIITDNDSKDNSCCRIEEELKNVEIIYSKDNLGFSKGNNLAVKSAKGKYVLFLNPDTIILDNSIEKSIEYLEKQQGNKTLIGVRLLNSDKSLQISSCKFPSIENSLFSSYPMTREKHFENHATDWVMGAYMLMHRDFFLSIGGFNESYFMYSEDLELCYNVKKNGGEVLFLGNAEIIHLYNQSGKSKWNKNRDKVVTNSTIKFINDNYSGLNKYLIVAILKVRTFVKGIIKG